MLKYFIYYRKSSEKEKQQILSIKTQLQKLKNYAKQNDLTIIKKFAKNQTTKKPKQPIFNQMLSEIDQGKASGILAWNPNHLTRNSVNNKKIIYLINTNKISSLKFPTF